MAEQLVITEKTSQAKDVRAAVGSRYGAVLPAEGHLFDLQEPEEVVPAWKRWTTVLLPPDVVARARPNGEFAPLYAAGVARRQADQIHNLSLTRTATVTLGGGQRSVIGIGRVKTPTLAIVCRRELEIRSFVPEPYHEVVARRRSAGRPVPTATCAQGTDQDAPGRAGDRCGGRGV
jgi:DNA topoisomerase IA